MMASNRSHRVDPELVEIVSQPRQGSDPPLSGNADLSPWEHEVRPAARARAGSSRGKIVAAVLATGVFLGTGFAIGAPVYAISRWWANRPVATATLETKSPVEAQAAGAPPASEAPPPSAAARSAILLDEEVMFGAPPVAADAVEAPEEAVAIPDPPIAMLTSEPPPTGPLRSEQPIAEAALIDPVTIDPVTGAERVATDPVAVESAPSPVTVERVTIAPLAVERVTVDQVAIDRVIVAPVAIDRINVDPAQVAVPPVDGEQRAAR